MDKAKQYRRSYGNWAGNPRGNKPNFNKCAEEVFDPKGWGSKQCSRSCGHGPDGAYCKQHASKLA